jgi:hypothetical protein
MKLSLIRKFTVGTFEEKASELNELVTLRGAAVGQQDDKFTLDTYILQQMQVTAESAMVTTGPAMSSLSAAVLSDEVGVKDDGASASDNTTSPSPHGIYIQITFLKSSSRPS